MYTLSIAERMAVLGIKLDDDGVSAADLDAREVMIQADLPSIPELAAAQDGAVRLEVYAKVVEEERARFVARFGSPFGETVKCSPRKPKSKVTGGVHTIVCDGVAAA